METATSIMHHLTLAGYGLSLVFSLVAAAGRTVMRRPAFLSALAGLGLQVLLLAFRWRASGHLPVTGLFETQHFLALWVMTAGLYFHRRYRAESFLPAAAGLAVAALIFGSRGPRGIVLLTPAIDTPLFFIHVATSFAAYGLFGVAALLGLYRLSGLKASLVRAERRMQDESLYVGYILFTWCMIAGSLWAYLAWGSYFTWKIKGLWSTILWFYYSGVLHVRNRRGWQGWPINILSILGFLLVLFTYLGLGLLFETSHPLL